MKCRIVLEVEAPESWPERAVIAGQVRVALDDDAPISADVIEALPESDPDYEGVY